jgi:hypothetical protein
MLPSQHISLLTVVVKPQNRLYCSEVSANINFTDLKHQINKGKGKFVPVLN